MTTAPHLLEARPRLRPGVVLGPAVRSGAALVHNVKDSRTGRYFQIGPREFFIVSRLDGSTTLAEIGREYATEFRRRLGEPQWKQILATLGSRQLLDGAGEVSGTESKAGSPAPSAERSLLNARITLVNPETFFRNVQPRLRWVFSSYFMVCALIAILALEVTVVVKATSLLDEARQLWNAPVAGLAVVVISWLTVALHEAAHGLTATHFGGSATEIGIMWRFPVLAPYCRVNDVLLFRRRRHRVYTAFAGVFAGLLALLPVVPVWLFAPPESSLRHAASALLVFGSLAAVANFIPFLQLDGYFMLNHALGMQNLRIESYRFIGQLLRAPRRDGDSGVLARQAAYPGRVRAIYVLYAAGSALFGIALACWFVYSLFVALQGSLGAVRAGAVVAMAVAAVTFALVTSQRRRRSKVDKPAT